MNDQVSDLLKRFVGKYAAAREDQYCWIVGASCPPRPGRAEDGR
jgi:hypothetical protein